MLPICGFEVPVLLQFSKNMTHMIKNFESWLNMMKFSTISPNDRDIEMVLNIKAGAAVQKHHYHLDADFYSNIWHDITDVIRAD